MTQLLLDEMLSPKIAEALRSAGIDVVSVSAEPNLRGLADSDVLDWAASERPRVGNGQHQGLRCSECAVGHRPA